MIKFVWEKYAICFAMSAGTLVTFIWFMLSYLEKAPFNVMKYVAGEMKQNGVEKSLQRGPSNEMCQTLALYVFTKNNLVYSIR